MQTQHACGSVRSLDDPGRLVKNFADVSALDLLQRWGGLLAGRLRPRGTRSKDIRVDVEHRARSKNHCPLDDVLKLANVARPIVGVKARQGFRADSCDRF